MQVDDSLHDGQPEPGAGLFGRDERLEGPLRHLRRNPWTIVDDGDLPCAVAERAADDLNCRLTAVRHRLDSVRDQIVDDLLQAVALRDELAGRHANVLDELDSLGLDLRAAKLHDLLEQRTGIASNRIEPACPRQVEEVVEQEGQPTKLVLNHITS